MSESKRKQSNSQKAQMQKKTSTEKNNKNNIEVSGYAADHEGASATKNSIVKNKNIKNGSPKKIEESSEEESTSTSGKQYSIASSNSNTNAARTALESNPQLTNGTSDQEHKKKKKHRRSFGKWRPFQRQEVIDSDDSADSDEEKSYIRSIRERVTLEEFERKATRELREKIEQARINRRFFLTSRRTPEQQAKLHKMQHLIGVNLFNPPREFSADEKELTEYDVNDRANQAEGLRALTLEDDEQIVTFHNRFEVRDNELAVPSYRDISAKYADDYQGYNPVQTDQFWSEYQAKYVLYDTEPIEMEVEPPLFQDKMPRRKHNETGLKRASSAGVLPSEKSSRVSKFFHPHRWSKIELDWCRALHAIYGTDWHTIAKLMCRAKQPPALQSAYVRSGGVLDEHHVTVQSMEVVCGLCQLPRDNKRMVFCTCCDRAYHLKCLDPPMHRIPSEWFCSAMCASVIKMKCELCQSASDDEKMLLCDGCDRGYHMYCLPVPLTAVPEGDWYCPSCALARGLTAPSPVATHVQSGAVAPTPRETSESSEPRVVPLIPIKCVLNSTASSAVPRSVIHKHWLAAQFSLLADSAPLCQQHNTTRSSRPWTPLKQPPMVTLDEPVTQLLHSSRLTYSQLRVLRRQCVTCLLHAAVDLPLGATVNLSHLPVPDHSIFTRRIRPSELTPDALHAHFTHHIQASVAAVERVQRDSVKKTPKNAVPKSSKNQRRVSFEATEPALSPAREMKPPAPVKRRKSESDVYKREYNKKKREIPEHDDTESAPVTRVKPAPVSKEENDGYEPGAPRYWVFQANPSYYDIETSVRELSDMTWFIKQQVGKVHLHDKVIIWQSGKNSGVLAMGTVTSEPADILEAEGMAKYTHGGELGAGVALRCHVHVDYVLPTRIDKATVRGTPSLSALTILRAPMGTNFRVTRNEAYQLEKLVLARSDGQFTPLYDHSVEEKEDNSDSTQNNTNVQSDANSSSINDSNKTNASMNGVEPVTPVKDEPARMTHVSTQPTQESADNWSTQLDVNQVLALVDDTPANNSNANNGDNMNINNHNSNNSTAHHSASDDACVNNNVNVNNESSAKSESRARKRQHEVTAEDSSPNKRRRTLPRAASQRRMFNVDDFLPDEVFSEAMMQDIARDSVIPPPVSASVEETPVTQPLDTLLNDTELSASVTDSSVTCVICSSNASTVQVNHTTGTVTFAQQMVQCHACQEQYHTHCVVPSITDLHALDLVTCHWLCPLCALTVDELTRVRTALVLLEVHYELRRLLREETEQIYFAMKNLITTASETDEVTSALQTRLSQLEQVTRDATRAALESFRAWHRTVA